MEQKIEGTVDNFFLIEWHQNYIWEVYGLDCC